MSHFKTAIPGLDLVEGGWITRTELVYHSDYLGKDITVPAGTFTDLASVPQIFQAIIPVGTGKNRRAAIVHDYLCRPEGKAATGVTQRQADIIFREALGVCGVGPVGQWGLFIPVRAFQAITGLFK